MYMKILLFAAIFFGGWLWVYLFVRQFLFNVMTAYPLMKKMNELQEDLIAVGAKRYTLISQIVCVLFSAIIVFIVIRFCPLYLIIGFFIGAIAAVVLLVPQLGPNNRAMFDAFCNSYYRFVPDDALRTAIYNKKTSEIKQRLHEMGIFKTFIPEFKK